MSRIEQDRNEEDYERRVLREIDQELREENNFLRKGTDYVVLLSRSRGWNRDALGRRTSRRPLRSDPREVCLVRDMRPGRRFRRVDLTKVDEGIDDLAKEAFEHLPSGERYDALQELLEREIRALGQRLNR